MTNDQVAALLEVFSFFFVGIDLYGPDRLGKAQNRLLNSSEYLHNKILSLQNYEWRKKRASKFMLIVYLINIINTGILLELGFGIFSSIPTAGIGDIIRGIIGFGFAWGFILMGFLICIVILIGVLDFIVSLLNLFTKGLISILKNYHMEGVFLFIGTSLFLISKYVQFYL